MQMTVRDASVDRFIHRVSRKRSRNEDHRGVGPGRHHRRGHRVEDRDALDVLPALPWGNPSHDVRPVRAVAKPVEATLRARQSLDDEPRVGSDEDCH